MTYRIAGIDVHKKMIAVVIADVAGEGEYGSSGASWAPARTNCKNWPNGCCNKRCKKS